MTQELLARPPGSCWPVYVKNSYKTEGFGFPFGFLKANTQKSGVTLTLVAYNYPALFTLLVNLNVNPGRTATTPNPEWLRDFSEYLSHTPSYYYAPLRNALRRIGLVNIIPPDQGTLSPGIMKILGKNKMQAKAELERFSALEANAAVDAQGSKKSTLCTNAFDVPRSELISALGDLKRAFFKELQLTSLAEFITPADSTSSSHPSPKSIQGVSRPTNMRLEAFMDSDDLHSLPIADMGIYQERMQKIQQENLRDPFRDEESVKSLQKTMFGNPYKQDKKVSIDEEDEAAPADASVSSNSTASGSSWSSIFGRKRKPRRRSVSPSHFPIEKIPSLAKGDGSISGKEQSISLGPPSSKSTLPMLRIVIRDSSGKAQMTEDTTERHVGMHDGEDESDDEDEYRRAVFNSDEMELDSGDEAARLRADTPMPGGMGLDDDDQDMEDMHRAQDMIPPPLIEVSREDIAQEISATLPKDTAIPQMMPERTDLDTASQTVANGSETYTSSSLGDGGGDVEGHTKADGRTTSDLTPIPLLFSEDNEAGGTLESISSNLLGSELSFPGIHHGPSTISNGKSEGQQQQQPLSDEPTDGSITSSTTTKSTIPSQRAPLSGSQLSPPAAVKSPLAEEQHSVVDESPVEFRNMMIKQMKLDPR
ncbi:Integrator complex subunit 6, partial [Modicella reniformis]